MANWGAAALAAGARYRQPQRPPTPPAPDPSRIAAPPAPRQTPTGGARPQLLTGAPQPGPTPNATGISQSGAGRTVTAGLTAPPRPAPMPNFNDPNRWTSLAAAGAKNPQMFVQHLAQQNKETAATGGRTPINGPAPVGGMGAGPTVQAPGAPPGVPDTSQQTGANTFNIPAVPADEMAKGEAQQAYDAAVGTAREGIQSAALGYGDPALMSEWGLTPTANPNSALALAALRAQQQQEAAGNARERAGTFFSSLHQEDLGKIGDAQQRAQLAGYQRYQNALSKFNAAMNAATVARQKGFDMANLDERQSAINTLPTAQTTASGGFNTGTTNATGKIQTPTAPKNAKVPTVKPPSIPKSKAAKPKAGGKPVGNKPPAVRGVKQAQRVPGKRR